jgi:hypothetical protein
MGISKNPDVMFIFIWIVGVVLLSWAISQIVWEKESFVALVLQVLVEGIFAILRLLFALTLFAILFVVALFKKPPNGKT